MLPGCHNYLLPYDIDLPAGTTEWNARITIKGPDDFRSLDRLGTLFGGGPVGVSRVFMCIPDGSYRSYDVETGRFDVTLTGTYTDAAGGGAIAGRGSFKLKPAETRTKFSVSTKTPRFDQPVRLSVETKIKGKSAYQALNKATVQPQVRLKGKWQDAKFKFTTNSAGRDSERYRWNIRQPATIRFVTLADDGFRKSVSNTITVRTQGQRGRGVRGPAARSDRPPAPPRSALPELRSQLLALAP